MRNYSLDFLKSDISHRRLRLKKAFDEAMLELDAADRTINESSPATKPTEHAVLREHAENAKDTLARAAADMEGLADLIGSLRRCDC